jgi:molybdopterin converting factor small subunit
VQSVPNYRAFRTQRKEKDMIEINIATPIRSCTEGACTVNVSADSVGEAMDCVMRQYPKLRSQLYDEAGGLRAFVALFLNGEDINMRAGLASPVRSGDTIEILLAVCGGCAEAAEEGLVL